MQRFRVLISLQNAFFLVIAVALGTRSQGSYVFMFVLSIIGLAPSLRCFSLPRCDFILAEARPVIVLLIGYILSLLLSGFLKGGLGGLRESLALYSSISFLFIVGISFPLWPSMLRFRSYLYILIPIALSLISSGLGFAISSIEMPVSSLRPSEFVFSIGLVIFFLSIKDFASMFAKYCSLRPIPGLVKILFMSGLLMATFAIVIYLFRGVISSSILIAVLFLILLDLKLAKLNIAIIGAALAGAAILLIALSPLMRFTIFKIFLSSFSASEGFADRFYLLGESFNIVFQEAENIPFFGPVSQNVDNFWAHNTFVDLFIHDGLIPAIMFSAFALAYAVLLLKQVHSLQSAFRFCLLPSVLLIGSFLQPVQYSDGIAYALSFLGLGYLLGSALKDNKAICSETVIEHGL